CAADLIGSTTPREKKTTAAIASVAIAATLVNPYGWRLWAFLIETVRLNRVEINDWQPVYRLGAVFVLLWMLVTVAMIAALAVALALIAGAAVASARNASCVHMDAWMFPEADVASVVQRAGLRGRMLIWFDWGEYAIWHFAPAIAVSIDGRRETVYSDAVVQQQLRFYFVPAERQAIVQRLRPDYVWVPSHLEVAHQLVGDGWTPV